MITFSCPRCEALQTVDPHEAGGSCTCTGCGQVLRVPQHAAAVNSGAPASELPAGPPAVAELRYDNGRPFLSWPCPHCRTQLQAPPENTGRAIPCPGCQRPVSVPDPRAGSILAGPGGRAQVAYGPGPRRQRSSRLVVALVIGALVLVAAVIALLIWQPWARKAVLTEEDMKFFPADTRLAAALNVEALLDSGAYRKLERAMARLGRISLKEAENEMKKQVGLGWSDLRSVTMGGALNQREEAVVVIKTRKEVSARDLLARSKEGASFDEEKVGPYRLYKYSRGRPDQAFGFSVVDSSTIVAGPVATLRQVLQRDRAPTLPADLKAAMATADFTRTFALAIGKIPRGMSGKLTQGFGAGNLNLAQFAGFLDQFEGLALEVNAGSNTIDVKVTVLCSDAKTAKQMEAMVSVVKAFAGANPRVPPEARDLLDSLKSSVSDKNVVITLVLDADKLVRMMERR